MNKTNVTPMAVIRLTKEFSFEMAHALPGYDGACSQIHGHSYRLFVTVAGEPENDPSSPKFGMVMDFGELKRIVNTLVTDRYDHTLMLRDMEESKEVIATLSRHYTRIVPVDYQPTCENLIVRFADAIRAALPAGVSLHSLRLHETANSYAEWFAVDNA